MKKKDIIDVINNVNYITHKNKNYKIVNYIEGLTISFNENSKIHSIKDKPAIIIKNKNTNDKFYLKKNILHRKNHKIAFSSDLTRLYFINGKEIPKNVAKTKRKQQKIKKKLTIF